MLNILTKEFDKKHIKGSFKGIGPGCKLVLALTYWREYRGMRQMRLDYDVAHSTVCDSIKWVEITLANNPLFQLEDIKTVISHPQAIEQAKEFIQAHGFDIIECANTALSALQVKESNDGHIASIASEETASLYGLEIIEKNINTNKNNTTRFAIFSKVRNLPSKEVKMGANFILVFTVKNEAGALAKTLNIIGMHNFNMRNLKSRPLSSLMWNYYFFVELEGNINTNEGKQMLVELGTLCDRLKLVGTYICK